MFSLAVFKCLFLCILVRNAISFRDVKIDSGVVRGYPAQDGDYLAFFGIPYAEPPLGSLRFKAPLPPPTWDNVFNATRRVRCPQSGTGEEDCLIVNVFTPTRTLNGPLPVVVYIHAGGYITGSGQTQGVEPLIKENIIIVTINYRLGALGFLCLGINEAPGNAGLKDQVAAFEWVQRNIREFGGDPNKVIAYGVSVGGASVDLLMLSNMGKGLFHKVIIESAVATAVWSVDADPIQTATNLAKAFGFENNLDTSASENLNMLVDLYRRLPADQLSVANMEYYRNLFDGTFGFVPCVEKKLSDTAPFITESPRQIIKKYGYNNKVPTMFIFASSEGLFLRSSDYSNYVDRMEANFKDFMLADLIFDTEEIEDEVTEKIRSYYFGNSSIVDNPLTKYLDYFGDTLVLHALLNSALTYAENEIDVYLMEFAYKGKMGRFDEFFDHLNLAGHADARKHFLLEKAVEYDDVEAVDKISKIVANFAEFSNPIPSITEQLPLDWPVVRPDNVTFLRFGKDLQLSENPYWERKIFWDQIYEEYRREIKPVNNGHRESFSPFFLVVLFFWSYLKLTVIA